MPNNISGKIVVRLESLLLLNSSPKTEMNSLKKTKMKMFTNMERAQKSGGRMLVFFKKKSTNSFSQEIKCSFYKILLYERVTHE